MTGPRVPIWHTVAAGVAGGLGFVAGTFLTFRLLGGSRPGAQGVLFDPATQHPKVIEVWKVMQPLPRILETPAVILGGLLLLGVAHAFVYRWIAAAWPVGVHGRALRLAVIVWLGAVFAEFMGSFNVMHQPLALSVVAWAFWAVCSLAEAYAIVLVLDRGRSGRRHPLPAGAAG